MPRTSVRECGAVFPRARCFISTLFLLFLLIAIIPPSQARDIQVDSWDVVIPYGERSRGEVFTDTLRFLGANGEHLVSIEADPTCDCLTAEVLKDGQVAIEFEVLSDELDGPTEKLVYVFTDSAELDLLRVRLSLDVLSEQGRTGSYDDESDSDLSGYLSDGDAPHDDAANGIQLTDSNAAADLIFFHSMGCRTCTRIVQFTLPGLEQRWGAQLRVHEVNLDDRVGYSRLLAVREHYGVGLGEAGSFLIAVGDTVLQTTTHLYDRLDAAIESTLKSGSSTYLALDIEPEAGREQTRNVLRSFSFWTVAGAGLLDGLNPCAFATLIFFISLLSYTGSTRRQIIIVGTGFTVSVFLVYLLLGLGAFKVLQALSAYLIVGQVIWFATVGLLAILIILSLRDTIQYYRTGKTSDAMLQLPRATKQKIHAAMRKGLKTSNLLIAAVGIGITVTLFEAACTGQVYLPAIVIMLNDPLMSDRAWLYLVLYNLLFIAPLLVVFALAYIGISSSSFGNWSKRNYGATRIALTALFTLFLVLLLLQRF